MRSCRPRLMILPLHSKHVERRKSMLLSSSQALPLLLLVVSQKASHHTSIRASVLSVKQKSAVLHCVFVVFACCSIPPMDCPQGSHVPVLL
jgi:hypothetical protein